MEKTGYDSERDLDNPTGSVFCAHGAGFVVPWNQVEEYMHLESGVDAEELAAGESWYEEPENEADRCGAENHQEGNDSGNSGRKKKKGSSGYSYSGSYEDEQELQAIFERTFGPVKRDREPSRRR